MKHIIAHGDQRWSLEGTQMEVEVILASKGPAPCPPIYTLRMRYPRIIHAEIMTHRIFSRNARSSRAVPVSTMLDEIRNTPFVPWHWGKNQKGMQAGEECKQEVHNWFEAFVPQPESTQFLDREDAWLQAADHALRAAEAFSAAGYHKQIVNRLLEPFMWIDTLITSTEWANFLWLRDHEAAEPHLQDLARLVDVAIKGAKLQTLESREWHLPYITDEYRVQAITWAQQNQWSEIELLQKLSAARCARISYKPFDGDTSYERELERYNSLVSSDRVHASPLEHQGTPDVLVALHKYVPVTEDTPENRPSVWAGKFGIKLVQQNGFLHSELSGNLGPGWIQYRKTVPGENHTS